MLLILYFGNSKQMLNDLVTYDCTNNSWGRALNRLEFKKK
jgi:hypothetical protein